jgi:hypothetical protein
MVGHQKKHYKKLRFFTPKNMTLIRGGCQSKDIVIQKAKQFSSRILVFLSSMVENVFDTKKLILSELYLAQQFKNPTWFKTSKSKILNMFMLTCYGN